MLLDTRQEALDAQAAAGPSFLRRPFLEMPDVLLTGAALSVKVRPFVAVIAGHVKQFAGESALVCYTGLTLAASSEVYSAVVAYHKPSAANLFVVTVDGTAALTSAGASAPTDAQIQAALPSDVDADHWVRIGVVKFLRDSGTGITCECYGNLGDVGTPTALKDVSEVKQETPGDSNSVYEPFMVIAFTIDAADITDADVLTDLPLPLIYGKIARWRYVIEKAITTGAKTTLPHLEIGATVVTGTDGTAIAGTKAKGVTGVLGAPTALNTFGPGATLSIVAASTTAFVEGRIRFEVEIYKLLQS